MPDRVSIQRHIGYISTAFLFETKMRHCAYASCPWPLLGQCTRGAFSDGRTVTLTGSTCVLHLKRYLETDSKQGPARCRRTRPMISEDPASLGASGGASAGGFEMVVGPPGGAHTSRGDNPPDAQPKAKAAMQAPSASRKRRSTEPPQPVPTRKVRYSQVVSFCCSCPFTPQHSAAAKCRALSCIVKTNLGHYTISL